MNLSIKCFLSDAFNTNQTSRCAADIGTPFYLIFFDQPVTITNNKLYGLLRQEIQGKKLLLFYEHDAFKINSKRKTVGSLVLKSEMFSSGKAPISNRIYQYRI